MADFECPSIFISRVFKSIKRSKIYDVFNALQLGEIEFVDLHLAKDFQHAYVYFKKWHTTDGATAIKERFLAGEEIKIIYDQPWFWKCKLNINTKTARAPVSRKPGFVSRYNTSNQILALKNNMLKERAVFEKALAEKDSELAILRDIIKSFKGDDALRWRKFIQQQQTQKINIEK